MKHNHIIQTGFNRFKSMSTEQKDAYYKRNTENQEKSRKWWNDNVKVERIDSVTGEKELINDPKRKS